MLQAPSDAGARFVLALLILAGFFGGFAIVVLLPIQTGLKDVLLVLLGAMVASYKDVTSFYYASSAGSKAKDAVIADVVGKVPPAPTPPAP